MGKPGLTMIKTDVRVHDNFHIEFKLNYNFNDIKGKKKYDMDMFFFIPESLNINKETYRKSDFYNDKQSYFRFMTPRFEIMQISDKPLINLEKSIDKLLNENTRKNKKNYIFQVKLFGSIFKSSLRDNVIIVTEQFEKLDKKDREFLIKKIVNESSMVIDRYRDLYKKTNTFFLDDEINKVFGFGDEYLSIMAESHWINLYKLTEEEELRQFIFKALKKEKDYREKNKFLNPLENKNEDKNYLFKLGALKKFINSALFLSTNWKKEGSVLEQAVLSMTAGAAMLVATVLTMYYQNKYSNFSYLVIFFIVLAYILKDRMKDLTRYYFSSRLRKRLYDHIILIKPKNGKRLGFIKEGISITDYENLSKDITNLREQKHLTPVEFFRKAENVVVYKKYVKLYPERINQYLGNYRAFGINDMTRINFEKYLKSMDNPEKLIGIADDDGVRYIKGKRIYYINILFRLSYKSRVVGYRRYRIALNRKGIIGLEEINLGLKNI